MPKIPPSALHNMDKNIFKPWETDSPQLEFRAWVFNNYIKPWATVCQKCECHTHTQWTKTQIAERLLCTRRTRVQIPSLAPYEIFL